MEIIKNEKTGKYICPYCDKEYKKLGIKAHIWRMHGDGIDFDPYSKIENRTSWNKGLSKETSDIIRKSSEKLSEGYKIGKWSNKGFHTQETKDKISKSRIKFLKENPDKVPYVLNHYSRGESYPETYFREVLENNNIEFIQEKRESVYSLDFVIGNIDLEIDGDQHYLDKKIVESDKRRTLFLENKGYSVIRIKWSDYQKLNKQEKEHFVKELIEKLSII